jgi:7-cyano-7-deazaguanine synthase
MKVLLFSGGLDSTALAYALRPDGLLFIDYGQIAAGGELAAATQIAHQLEIPIETREINCRSLGAGDMVGNTPISPNIPEFWPFRNQLLVTVAAMAYYKIAPLQILIGTVKSDSVHTDGRPEFIHKMNELLGCQADIKVSAPAHEMETSALLEFSHVPLSILSWAFSCHRGTVACGQCRGCTKHFAALESYSQMGQSN